MSLKKVGAIGFWVLIALLIVGGAFYAGYERGKEFPKTIVVQGVSNIESSDSAIDFSTFWEAWGKIDEIYLKSNDVPVEERVYGAIRGLVRSLGDPHSEFFDPKDNKKFREDIRGNFGGIGAEIGIRKDQLIIIAPLENTPASKAGLRPGDFIVKVNSSSTEGLAVDEAVGLIRGPVNTPVVLTVAREGWEVPKEITIVRQVISLPTLGFAMKGNIAHVEFHGFNANLNKMFFNAVNDPSFEEADGMVLDLRNNPGGYLDVAVDMAGWFLKKGTLVVSEEGLRGTKKEFRAEGSGIFSDFPIVVLVNQGSASASEILAGALKDQRGITLVGEKTYGKGTVQELVDLHEGSSLKLTVAHWVLPSGKILEGEGIPPDVQVELTDEDIQEERDPQLDKAIELLKEKIRPR